MIALIEGQVQHLFAPVAIIMTKSGIGYEIELPLNAFCQLQLQQQTTLWTYLLVREDAQLLYGFLTHQDRELFRLLLKINGVGAKMALAIMSTLNLAELKHHVANGDETALTRIPSVGKKTAQRLLIELHDKLKHLDDQSYSLPKNHQPLSDHLLVVNEAQAGLMALGYKEKEAQAAIKLAKQQLSDDFSVQDLLKLALKHLANH